MEFDEFDPDVFGKISKEKAPLATHCDIPLKYNKQRAALGIPSVGQYIPRGNYLKREYEDLLALSGNLIISRLDLSNLQRTLLNLSAITTPTQLLAEWSQQLRLSSTLWDLNIKCVKSCSMLPCASSSISLSQQEKAYLFQHYKVRSFWEEAVLLSGSSHYKPKYWWKLSSKGYGVARLPNLNIYLSTNLILIQSELGNFLASRDHLLILSDLASQRYLLRLLSICELRKKNLTFLTPSELDTLLDNGDKILEKAGNKAYKYIYTLEPTCISMLTGNIPVGSIQSPTFFSVIKNTNDELATSLDIWQLHLERLHFLLKYCDDPSIISQIYGLYRIWGHPTLEPLEGTSALKGIATKVRWVNQEAATNITNKFKEEFIMRYISREKKWPLLDISQLSPTDPIKKSYERKADYPIHHKDYKRSRLTLVSFKQIFPVDPKFDLIEMIADKAMSLFTPDLIEYLSSGRGVGSSIDRSVLVQWMKSSLHDPKEFLLLIDKNGFSFLERSMGVKEKEREGKLEARLFGLMTLIKRMYIVLTEALLAEYVLEYFPEITMTDDELSLDKKRLLFNNPKLLNQAVFTSLDFSKWNSNMREAETQGVFEVFDQMFGFTNCFQRTHEMFKSSFIYLLNGSYLPTYRNGKFIPDLGSWQGHLGGIEGLRQKGWTIWTVILILLAAEELPIKLKLMGQGDNQILREIFPSDLKPERQMEIHFQFIDRLNNLLATIGPPLKTEETWTSRDFFVYGKYLIWRGNPLPMYAKRICRMFRLSNEDFPTLESTISSLTANFSSALAYSYDPGYLLFLYYTELIGTYQLFFQSAYLQKQPLTEKFKRGGTLKIPKKHGSQYLACPKVLASEGIQPDLLLLKLSILPRCLGGFPTANLFSSLLRGFPDEVSFAISTLRLMYVHSSPELQGAILGFLNPSLNPETNYMLLFEHPTSLNLNVPPTPSEARRNVIINFLQKSPRVKNSYLRTFLSLMGSPYEKLLIDYLATAEPFMPRLLSQIAKSTTESRARHIAGKLQKTKTISSLAQLEGEKDIYNIIETSEANHVLSILKIMSEPVVNYTSWTPDTCSVEHASKLRELGWKRKIEGVDCVPPQEFLFIESLTASKPCHSLFDLPKGYIIMRITTALTPSELHDPLTTGHYTPYRGSVTHQKISGFGDKLAEVAEPLLQKVLRAFNLIGWGVKPDGNLAELLTQLLMSKTDLDPQWLIPDEARLTGSTHHRLQDDRTGHGGSVAILPNYGTRVTFDTFPLYEYSKGSKNVNLMFQSLMSFATSLASWAFASGWTPDLPTIHLHVKQACCVREVNETLVECPTTVPPCVTMYPDSPYLYCPADKYLTQYLKELLISPDAPKAMTASVATTRFISSMSEEIIDILQLKTWDQVSWDFNPKSLMINWCIKTPLLLTMEFVALRLCVSFIDAVRFSTPSQYLIRIAENISRSPLYYWAQLSNLIFAPNYQHDLVSAPYHTHISGDPCMTNEVCGSNLRGLCQQILLTWSSDFSSRARLNLIDIQCSQNCGLIQHPSLLFMVRDWLLGTLKENIRDVKHEILRMVSTQQNVFTLPLEILGSTYIQMSRGKIFRESTEVLAKMCMTPSPKEESRIRIPVLDLPQSAIVLYSFEHRNLMTSEFSITPTHESPQHFYETHIHRPIAIPTSGMYKALSLFQLLQLYKMGKCMCLGDGSGGYTWAVLTSHETNMAFFNTLIAETDIIQQAPPIPFIPALAGWPEYESRIINLKLTNEGISDITHPKFNQYLKTNMSIKFDGLICDAETPDYLEGINALKLAWAVKNISLIQEVKWTIFKTYALNPSILRAQISILLSLFSKISIIRSDFSSAGNTEVFLYCTDPKHEIPLRVIGPKLRGMVLYPESISILEDIKRTLLEGAAYHDASHLIAYTTIINKNNWLPLEKQVLSTLPMLAEQVELVYPHSVLTWMRSCSQLHPGLPKLIQTNLETKTFTNQIVGHWAVCWILLGLWSGSVGVSELSNIINHGVAVWYLLNNDTWEISLTLHIPPEKIQGTEVLVWELINIIRPKDLKIIHKTYGILLTCHQKPRKLALGLNRGSLNVHGNIVGPKYQPQSRWVHEYIFSQGKSEETEQTTTIYKGPIKSLWEQRMKRRRKPK